MMVEAAWILAIILGALAAIHETRVTIAQRGKRWNAKCRAVDRTLSNGVETLKDRQTKLPPIL